MTNLNITNILYCRLDGLTALQREQVRYQSLSKLGLINSQNSLAILDEATQSSSNFLEAPIALLSIFVDSQQLIKSVLGLNNLGFNHELVVKKQIPPSESFCIHVVDSLTALAIENTLEDPFFCQSLLTQHCGVRSYLGVPLITTTGECIGTLAVMDLQPRKFVTKDLQFLGILARLTMTQLENQGENLSIPYLQQLNPLKSLQQSSQSYQLNPVNPVNQLNQLDQLANAVTKATRNLAINTSQNTSQNTSRNILTDTSSSAVTGAARSEDFKTPVKLKLLVKLIEELRTPLTAVMGMTGILQQQIYGLLTLKQQEYLEVIHQSGQRMLTRIEEILALDIDNVNFQQMHPAMVDMEMLCQQVINTLQGVIQSRKQKIYLEIQEGSRLWVLDRLKVRQMLYYLVAVMADTLPIGSQMKIMVDQIVDQQEDYLCIRIFATQVDRRLAETKSRSTSSSTFNKPADKSAGDSRSNSFLNLTKHSAHNSAHNPAHNFDNNSSGESAFANKFQLTVDGMDNIGLVTEQFDKIAIKSSQRDGVVSSSGRGETGGIESDRAEPRYHKVSMQVPPEMPIEMPIEIPTEMLTGVSISEYLGNPQNLEAESWHRLGLLLSCYLAEIHNGKIMMQGSKESSYAYVVMLPQSQLN